ncbi:MAG: ATP-binding domain-containing protein [Acetatifactor sp.]|nr:ATP-binding domain-containing protein [Acetatifactor sp.]
MSKPNAFYGTTREDEEKKLLRIRRIAEDKVKKTEQTASNLQEELKSLREVYDVEDKEGLAQWFNTDARFSEVRNDLNRAKRACHKPFFGRIDIEDSENHKKETFYIGKSMIADNPSEPEVIDWRAPIASVYYDHSLGLCSYKVPKKGIFQVDLKRKRTYEIEDERIIDFYDSDVVANDDLLTKYLSKSKRNVLSEIIATIQQEQNEVIRKNPHHNVLVQGSAGSGKTTVAMHRISYILYNYEREFKPDSFYIVGSNKVLLNYITGVLPDLDVYGVRQLTMEELFVRLLYEDWDKHKITVRPLSKNEEAVRIKTSSAWFEELRRFCISYELKHIPSEDITLEQTGHVIMTGKAIKDAIKKQPDWPMWRKFERLNDLLRVGLENEIYGKYHSYNPEQQKKLTQKYKSWFQRYALKDSVFTLYDAFMEQQKLLHPGVAYTENEPDLYDLASLAYIYKRLKETEVIQEASHVVIDEAQDFGMSVYHSLKYCMSKCTFTVMGDVSQNINFGLGLSDWEELKKVLLPGKFDYFGLLRKSYRNTVEISNFATDILRHGTFPIYPVEPIIRHGEEVGITECKNETKLLNAVAIRAKEYLKKNYETIAIICKDRQESEIVCRKLSGELDIHLFSDENSEFSKGVYALPIEYSKGLEFDAVIIYDASQNAYPKEDGYARLLYVAATRALHELAVFSLGELTGLIKDPIPENRKNNTFQEDSYHIKPRVFEEDFRTNEEIAVALAKEGDRERALREKYGPRKIIMSTPSVEPTKPVAARRYAPGSYLSNLKSTPQAPQTSSVPEVTTEFFTMPEATSLTPIGHGKIDNSVRWVKQDKHFVEITGSYGTMRIIPISDETVRILFGKGIFSKIKALPEEITFKKEVRWTYRETRELLEITMAKLIVREDKKTGALTFLGRNGQPLLSESSALCRQYHGSKDIWWEYFAWSRKETLSARGRADSEWKDLSLSAKYISHGSTRRPTLLMSSKGYQLLVPGGIRVLACTIPAHGPYLCFEDSEIIDYIFRGAR